MNFIYQSTREIVEELGEDISEQDAKGEGIDILARSGAGRLASKYSAFRLEIKPTMLWLWRLRNFLKDGAAGRRAYPLGHPRRWCRRWPN